ALFERAPTHRLDDRDQYVIFSDLHMGNGGHSDDFAHNADLFNSVLRRHYLRCGFSLILNGDVEELQRFPVSAVEERWAPVYELFAEFRDGPGLHWLIGNHDKRRLHHPHPGFPAEEALVFDYGSDLLFIFHGHQSMAAYEKHNAWVGFVLKYIATPLRIKNYEVSHNSAKRFRTEKRVYDFATSKRVLAVIGHTHRPLFESMSKLDSVKFEVERLCRKYPKADAPKRRRIESKIATFKEELRRMLDQDHDAADKSSLYSENLVVPSVFNSGSVLGKRGVTALEIDHGKIRLVHWFDATRSKRYLQYRDYRTDRLDDTDYHRVVIKSDSLSYVLSRIKLLA
ncbi:MAG: metallophosphoesterase, partial [Spirochaetota bacterium]